jgi:hypothetical protein
MMESPWKMGLLCPVVEIRYIRQLPVVRKYLFLTSLRSHFGLDIAEL